MSNSWPPPRLTGVPARDSRDGLTILFVDPDVLSAQRLAMALGGLLSSFAVAATAQAAVAAIRARMPDVVVMELDLPDVRGVELISWLQTTPATRHVLLLVLTAQASVMQKVAAFQAGADDYLVKPVEAGMLATHLRLLMRFRQVLG